MSTSLIFKPEITKAFDPSRKPFLSDIERVFVNLKKPEKKYILQQEKLSIMNLTRTVDEKRHTVTGYHKGPSLVPFWNNCIEQQKQEVILKMVNTQFSKFNI